MKTGGTLEKSHPVKKCKGLFVFDPYWFDIIYAPEDRALLRRRVDFPDRAYSPAEIRQNLDLLRDVELLFSGWDGGTLDKAILDAAPQLKAVFFGGGSIRRFVTEDFWDRDIPLSSAASANAVPVAEFTLAEIILSLKHTWWHSRRLHRTREYPHYNAETRKVPGAYHSTVGIISLGLIGQRLRNMLRMLDVHVIAYDPYTTQESAMKSGIELVSLPELFGRSDVVTIHTPLLEETEGMVGGELIASMKRGATLINTARGGLINEAEMIEVLQRRPDLFALLDVTDREPLEDDSPLFTMPNVLLTPHLAGSMNGECKRMGRWMIEEAERFLNNEPLLWQIKREKAPILA